MDKLKLGILIPRSRQFPELGFQFLAGIRDVFAQNTSLKHDLIIEDVGVEASKNTVMEKAQKLLLQHQADLVIAFVGNHVSTELSNLFDSLKKILIITNMGENNIIHPASPFVFDHSMGLYTTCWEMGYHLAQRGKKNVLVSSSFYDSGYGLYAAFATGLNAGGGNVSRLMFSGDIPDETYMVMLEQWAHANDVDAIYAIYCGKQANAFLNYYFQNSLLKTFPLFGSTFFLPEKIDNHNGYNYSVATSCGPDEVKKPFYVQGTEVAQLLVKAFGPEKAFTNNADKIRGQLETAKIESMRGKVVMDTLEHITTAPVYLTQYAEGLPVETTLLQQQTTAKLTVARGNILSGFINPYLCM